jgi:hypothetical protein|tara:strand:- start:3640 stop:3870 length:231 start_codon:yes stop_codon:yes gene_type:complete
MGRPGGLQPICYADWDAIQEAAKADARRAIETGDSTRLTALGRAYFEKYSKESAEAERRRNRADKPTASRRLPKTS